MNRNKFSFRGAIVLAFMLLAINVNAQKQAQLLKSESFVNISGTSTLHDWEEHVKQFDSNLEVHLNGSKIESVNNGFLKCSVKDIESGNSLMNKKTFNALNGSAHPDILFTSNTVENIKSDNSHFSFIVKGSLSVAGVSRDVSIPVKGTINKSVLKMEGSVIINMTDYGVAPPTFMGAIKTGQTVTISFLLTFLI